MLKTHLRPVNDGYANSPAQWFASVPNAESVVDDSKIDMAWLRVTLADNQRRSLARLRIVRLAIYTLAVAGLIALISLVAWIEVTMPGR